MNSVYVPVHVVVLLRRLVNVVSTLSISNQYLLHKQGKAEAKTPVVDGLDIPQAASARFHILSLESFEGLKELNWPWRAFRSNWDRLFVSEDRLVTLEKIRASRTNGDTVVKASSISLPWIGSGWSLPSMFSSLQATTRNTEPRGDGSSDPPPSTKRSDGKKPSKDPFKLPPELKEPSSTSPDIIHQLLVNPALYDPLRTPRYPIALCHGLYGFDTRGPSTFPSMRMHYWANVLKILRDTVGADVIVTSVPGTGSITTRAERLDHQLQDRARGRGVNFLAHSMGGLDCRHLITHLKPLEYTPLSLTTIGTPHRGSPFMDWCADNIGIGKLREQERNIARSQEGASSVAFSDDIPQPSTAAGVQNAKSKSDGAFSLSLSSLPSSFTTLLLSIVDSPAYANLTSTYLNTVFNPSTPDDPNVKYFSVAGRMPGVNIWHPFWLPKMVLDGVEEKERSKLKLAWEKEREAFGSRGDNRSTPLWAQEREWGNDGLVTVQSAKWGEFLGIMEGCDHWEMRGARGIEFGVDLPAIPAIGLGLASSETVNGDGWGLNWGRFVGTWKTQETMKRNSGESSTPTEKISYKNPREREENLEAKRQRARDSDDEVVKSSTDRLSSVFDWLIDQIPAPQQLGAKGKVLVDAVAGTTKVAMLTTEKVSEIRTEEAKEEVSDMKKRMNREGLGRKENELETKEDIERFYVALSRKMYDEGL